MKISVRKLHVERRVVGYYVGGQTGRLRNVLHWPRFGQVEGFCEQVDEVFRYIKALIFLTECNSYQLLN